MPLFDRVVKLTIGEAGETVGSAISYSSTDGKLTPRIQFQVTKNNSKDPNTAKITVSNALNAITQILPQDADLQNYIVTLEAGYAQDSGLQVLYIGSLTNIELHPQKPTNTVVLTANDGYAALTGKKFGKSYAKKTDKKVVAKDIFDASGLPQDGINLGTLGIDLIESGYTASGNIGTALDTTMKSMKLRWSIQNGKIRVVPMSGVAAGELVLARIINAQTGMIGAPEKVIDPDHGVGYRVRSLLLPAVEPDDMVVLTTLGNFRAYKAVSDGDSHGSQFNTELLVFSK